MKTSVRLLTLCLSTFILISCRPALCKEQPVELAEPDAEPQTVLCNAAMQANVHAVKRLLKQGVPVDPTGDQKGTYTPLMGAAAAGYDDPSGEWPRRRLGYEKIVRLLLRRGAGVNARDTGDGTEAAPLMEAAQGQSFKIVQMLITRGANVNARDAEGRTALMRAARLNSLKIVKLLIARGAQVDASNKKGYTALMAASLNSIEIAKYLVSKGARVNARTKRGATAIMMAADSMRLPGPPHSLDQIYKVDYREKNDMVRWLLSKGANINAQTTFGTTALLRAVHLGSVGTLRLLIEKGANRNLKDNQEGTPLTLARRLSMRPTNSDRNEITRLLETSGTKE